MTVSREETQEKLARMGAAQLSHTPGQKYTVTDRLEEKAKEHPDKIFVLYENQRVSYGELNAMANRVAHAAQRWGLSTGDTVALMMENRPEYLATWMGLAKLGVISGLVNTNVVGKPLFHELEAVETQHVIVGSECLGQLETLGDDLEGWRVHVYADPAQPAPVSDGANDLDAALAQQTSENPNPQLRSDLVAGDDLFYMFTSGTTGLPKAARLSHMRWLGVGESMGVNASYTPDDVIACVLPLYHGAGGMVVVSCALKQGATIFLRRKFSASRFWDDARQHGVTGVQYIGEICRYLLNQPPRENDRDHGIRVMMGAGLGPDIWQEFQQRFGVEKIIEGWSSTEANTSVINLDNKVGSCGRIPFKDRHNGRLIRFDPETETHPRDENGFCIECEAGEIGEFIGMILNLPGTAAGRFEGYTSKEATENKILHDVFQQGDQWYRSGDLLRHDEEGYFYFVDRIGDTFRWKSENVSTQEVAEALSGFPSLDIANVYGVQIPNTEGRAGMAALVFQDPSAFDGRRFFEFTQERLPPYAAPVFLRLTRAPDLTSTFKLRKVDLQREGWDPAEVGDPIFVRDEAAGAYLPLESASKLPRL